MGPGGSLDVAGKGEISCPSRGNMVVVNLETVSGNFCMGVKLGLSQ